MEDDATKQVNRTGIVIHRAFDQNPVPDRFDSYCPTARRIQSRHLLAIKLDSMDNHWLHSQWKIIVPSRTDQIVAVTMSTKLNVTH